MRRSANHQTIWLEESYNPDSPYLYVKGPIVDGHMHPRIYDVLLPHEPEIPNGKSGLDEYTKAAMRGGFVIGVFILNESMRQVDENSPDGTRAIPFPVNSAERLNITATLIGQQSRIKGALLPVIDQSITHLKKKPEVFTRTKIRREFSDPRFQRLAAGIKIFVDESTGGFNVEPDIALPIAEVFHESNPGKPVCVHAEGENVARVLDDWPDHIPIDILHVSSKQELEAVIIAKEDGKDVQCEGTMHHMALTEEVRDEIDAYGCMKPSIKSAEDRQFLRDNVGYIDRFGSDCAPHRRIDKEGIDGRGLAKPAFGVTNHGEFLPFFFQEAFDNEWLTHKQLYERIVTNPLARFNLPRVNTTAKFILEPITAQETASLAGYGCNPFVRMEHPPEMRGHLVLLAQEAGKILVSHGGQITNDTRPSYNNLVQY
jgi:hypothetical protein